MDTIVYIVRLYKLRVVLLIRFEINRTTLLYYTITRSKRDSTALLRLVFYSNRTIILLHRDGI